MKPASSARPSPGDQRDLVLEPPHETGFPPLTSTSAPHNASRAASAILPENLMGVSKHWLSQSALGCTKVGGLRGQCAGSGVDGEIAQRFRAADEDLVLGDLPGPDTAIVLHVDTARED